MIVVLSLGLTPPTPACWGPTEGWEAAESATAVSAGANVPRVGTLEAKPAPPALRAELEVPRIAPFEQRSVRTGDCVGKPGRCDVAPAARQTWWIEVPWAVEEGPHEAAVPC